MCFQLETCLSHNIRSGGGPSGLAHLLARCAGMAHRYGQHPSGYSLFATTPACARLRAGGCLGARTISAFALCALPCKILCNMDGVAVATAMAGAAVAAAAAMRTVLEGVFGRWAAALVGGWAGRLVGGGWVAKAIWQKQEKLHAFALSGTEWAP